MKSQRYPILPLRDIVLFNGMAVNLYVGREISINALEAAIKEHSNTFIALAQKNLEQDLPQPKDMFKIGTLAEVGHMVRLQDSHFRITAKGLRKVQVRKITIENGLWLAETKVITDQSYQGTSEEVALLNLVAQHFEEFTEAYKKLDPALVKAIMQLQQNDPDEFIDMVVSNLVFANDHVHKKQKILEARTAKEKLQQLLLFIGLELDMMKLRDSISRDIETQIQKNHREYYLQEQLKAIQKQLSGGDGEKDELSEIQKKITTLKLPAPVKEKAEHELHKLRSMNSMSAEANVIRTYLLEWLLAMPWSIFSKSNKNLAQAQKILDNEHYGLEEVKERIIEHLATKLMKGHKVKSPILCLVGPPGIGKTSLAKSIAHATNREFFKIPLGGIRDDAEIRGHRRTYVGAMPGQIVRALKSVKTCNPVILLDEIDKIGHDYRGDPASALLEATDPSQNYCFRDLYLEVDCDLSDVLFVATANTTDTLPFPLRDRLEIIRLSSYTDDEKLNIAREYLVPNQLKEHGIEDKITIEDEALMELIHYYTREAGVRSLNRAVEKIARKSVKAILLKEAAHTVISSTNLKDFLGVKKYQFGLIEEKPQIGLVNGLAYTDVGGDILAIEAVTMPGKGDVRITGKLGEVMRESALAAFSYVRSRAKDFNLTSCTFSDNDVHIHVPEGAVPKDGPSAGIAICCSIISALTRIPVDSNVAMTGEITLSGRVLAIGGLKEKLLAAARSGVKKVVIPRENVKDLEKIPDKVKKSLEIHAVQFVDEVLPALFTVDPRSSCPMGNSTEHPGTPTIPPQLESLILEDQHVQ